MKDVLTSFRLKIPQWANYAHMLLAKPDFMQTFIEAIEQSEDAFCITDSHGHIEYANKAFKRLSGYSQTEALGQTLRLVKSGRQSDLFYKNMWGTISAGMPFRETMANRHKNGHLFYVDETITPLKNNQGKVIYFLTVWKDVTRHHKTHNKILHQALHDPLTHLPNRSLLYDRLESAIKKNRRTGQQIAVLFIDLDKFKPINDLYGHDVGDEVLRQVAHRLKKIIRESDTVARLGGDEFVVILEEIKSFAGVIKVAEAVLGRLSQTCRANSLTLTVGASIGISLFPNHGTDSDTLLRKADLALHVAKEAGGGKFEIFTSA